MAYAKDIMLDVPSRKKGQMGGILSDELSPHSSKHEISGGNQNALRKRF